MPIVNINPSNTLPSSQLNDVYIVGLRSVSSLMPGDNSFDIQLDGLPYLERSIYGLHCSLTTDFESFSNSLFGGSVKVSTFFVTRSQSKITVIIDYTGPTFNSFYICVSLAGYYKAKLFNNNEEIQQYLTGSPLEISNSYKGFLYIPKTDSWNTTSNVSNYLISSDSTLKIINRSNLPLFNPLLSLFKSKVKYSDNAELTVSSNIGYYLTKEDGNLKLYYLRNIFNMVSKVELTSINTQLSSLDPSPNYLLILLQGAGGNGGNIDGNIYGNGGGGSGGACLAILNTSNSWFISNSFSQGNETLTLCSKYSWPEGSSFIDYNTFKTYIENNTSNTIKASKGQDGSTNSTSDTHLGGDGGQGSGSLSSPNILLKTYSGTKGGDGGRYGSGVDFRAATDGAPSSTNIIYGTQTNMNKIYNINNKHIYNTKHVGGSRGVSPNASQEECLQGGGGAASLLGDGGRGGASKGEDSSFYKEITDGEYGAGGGGAVYNFNSQVIGARGDGGESAIILFY